MTVNIHKQFTSYINLSKIRILDNKLGLSEKEKTELGKFLITIEEVGKSITEDQSSTDKLTLISKLRQAITKCNKKWHWILLSQLLNYKKELYDLTTQINRSIGSVELAEMKHIQGDEQLKAFLNLQKEEQELLLKDSFLRNQLVETIKKETEKNPGKIYDKERGLNLFLTLCRQTSSQTRQLSEICLGLNKNLVDSLTKYGSNALFYACAYADLSLVKILRRRGIDPLKMNKRGKFPHDFAKSEDILVELTTWTEYLEGKDKEGVEGWTHLLMHMVNKTPESVKLFIPFLKTIKLEKIQYKNQPLFKALAPRFNQLPQNAIPYEFIGVLIVQEAEIDLTDPEVHDVFNVFLNYLLTQKTLDREQIKVLKAIFDRGLIPWRFLDDNQSFFKLLESRKDLPKCIQERMKKINPNAIQLMQLKDELQRHVVDLDPLESQYITLCQMIEKAKLLKKQNFPSMSFCVPYLNTFMNKKFGNLNQIVDDVLNDEKSWSNIYSWLPGTESRFIRDRLYHLERYEKLKLALLADRNVKFSYAKRESRDFVGLLLDKTFFTKKGSFHGGRAEWTSTVLANAIKKITDSIESPVSKMDRATWDTMKRFLTDHFLPMLHQCALWDYLRCESNRNKTDIPESLFNQIANRIEKMKIGTKILNHTGCIKHGTGLVVEKTATNRLRLSFYNTGKGLREHHPRWKKTHLFQTYLTYTNVPIDRLQHSKTWKKLFELKRTSHNMNPIYKYFQNILTKGGTLEPPSKNEGDYEQSQLSCSCAYQFILAALRHECMLLPVGTEKEKLAFYKLMKAAIFHPFAKDELKNVDKTVQLAAITKLKKLGSDLNLGKIAGNREQYIKVKKNLSDTLKQLGNAKLANTLESIEDESFLMRYHLLRTYSQSIAKLLTSDSIEKLSKETLNSLEFALSQYEHHQTIRKGLLEDLDTKFEDKVPPEVMSKRLALDMLATRFSNECLDWTFLNIESIDEKENPYARQCLAETVKMLAQYRSADLIDRLIQGYKSRGKRQVVNFIHETAQIFTEK